MKLRILPDDDWQGESLKQAKKELKKRKKIKDPTALIIPNIVKVMTLKMNSIAERTLEDDS